MLSSSVFSSFNCPDSDCRRPYCQYRHQKSGDVATISISNESVPTTSSSVIVISQEETPILNDYVGFYSTPTATFNPSPSSSTPQPIIASTFNQAYDPFANVYGYNSSTSYAPQAPTTSYNNSVSATNSYLPEFNTYNLTTTTSSESYNGSGGGFTAEDDEEEYIMDPKPSNVSPHKSKKGQGFVLHNEVMDPAPAKKAEQKLRIRKDSSEFVDPSKPILPPDLSKDEILQFGKHSKLKEREKPKENFVSKKAKKLVPKILTESQVPSSKKTETLNFCMKNVAAIDRQLDDLKNQRKKKFEENMKRHSIDVEALFEVDEPPPRKIAKTSSSASARESTDSVRSNKPQKAVPPSPKPQPSRKSFESKNDEILVISHKPPPPQQLKGARVAHQPTVANVPTIKKKTLLKDQIEARQKSVAAAATKSTPSTTSSSTPKQQQTLITSFNKGASRVAHMPKAAPSKAKTNEPQTKPSLKDINSKKVPIHVRQRILDKLVTEFCQFMPRSEAIITAQDEEYDMLTKSATRTGYCSSVSGIIKRAREMINNRKSSSSKASGAGISHLELMKGRHAGEISIGVNKHVKKNAERVSEYSEAELYEALFDKYIMTNEQLEENGYPLWVDETKKDLVQIKKSELDAKTELYVAPNNPLRTCCRCKANYRIKLRPDDVVDNSDCVYHWGKFWKKKVQAQWVPRYTCCDMGAGTPGCSLGKEHVTQMQTTDVFKEFVEAPARREGYDERSCKIFALDCEMVYTSLGPAVARLSVVDYRGDKILDEIIRPPGELIDTNFRFSGLEEDAVLNAKLDLAGAQERFFELINRDTILIGHSLESDLKSMKIVHKNVIDTSVLFPHRQGPPFKRALKNLSSEILMEIIQEDITGHDSAEDAQIALKLVLHKLKNE